MSVSVDVGVMWRLSEDFNRRFSVRMQAGHHHHPHHSHHHPHHHATHPHHPAHHAAYAAHPHPHQHHHHRSMLFNGS